VLSVDPASGAPPYEQLRRQVVEQVAAGMLRPGARLPPVRRLAEDLGLAAGTVARAYRELEAAGVVETRGRAGTVVARPATGPSSRRRRPPSPTSRSWGGSASTGTTRCGSSTSSETESAGARRQGCW
jgi:DNA-binding transcriptional regulator YhcF (GntR family)